MREFDALCLTPIQKMTPQKIRRLRTREKTSQTVFAAYLNVTPGLISKWERGEKRPQGTSLKLLSLIEKKGLEIVA
jgi:putative transcriptional regulator